MIRFLTLLLLPLTLLGKDLTLEIPNLPAPIQISLPENFDPAVKHPTFFFYYGAGGAPTTTFMRTQAGNDDWIIVGMSYTQQGQYTLNEQSMSAERTLYHTVRKELITKHAADPAHCYIGGFSQGGWHTDLMLQAEPTLSGGIIMGAGHAQVAPGAFRKYASQKPIHIAIGRSDPNYIFALKGFLHHRKLGGSVSLEAWPDLAHAYPLDGSDSIRQWLTLRTNSPTALAPTAVKELTAAVKRAKTLEHLATWDRLIEIKGMPYFALTPAAWQANFKKDLAAVEATPEIATEAMLYTQHRRLLHQEITNRNMATLKKVNQSYLNFSNKHPKTRQGKLMAADYNRTAAILKQIKVIPSEKKPTQVPSGPVPQRRIPRNPLVR